MKFQFHRLIFQLYIVLSFPYSKQRHSIVESVGSSAVHKIWMSWITQNITWIIHKVEIHSTITRQVEAGVLVCIYSVKFISPFMCLLKVDGILSVWLTQEWGFICSISPFMFIFMFERMEFSVNKRNMNNNNIITVTTKWVPQKSRPGYEKFYVLFGNKHHKLNNNFLEKIICTFW